MKITQLLLSVLVVASLSACKSAPPAASAGGEAKATSVAEANLTQKEAETRAAGIDGIHYRLQIALDATSSEFTGQEHLTFKLTQLPRGLFLDFQRTGRITAFKINGQLLKPQFENHRIDLPRAALLEGDNEVEISYVQTYAHNGRGLHRFVDPEDKRVYMYTQFENYDAHQMFPCFDQPDMKATMELSVVTPKDWEVITTTRE